MRIQYHTYEDSNYTFEMTIRTEHDPATVAEIYTKAATEWYESDEMYDTMADWMKLSLEMSDCIIEDWIDRSDYWR